MERYDISMSERRAFWDEIKTFATKEDRKRDEGSNAVTRSFYQQYCSIPAKKILIGLFVLGEHQTTVHKQYFLFEHNRHPISHLYNLLQNMNGIFGIYSNVPHSG